MAAGRCAQVAQLVKLASAGTVASGHAVLQSSVHRCRGRLQQLQGGDVVDLTWSLATLRWKDATTWKDIGSAVTQKVEEMKVAELVKVAGAFSVASQRDPEMLTAMVGRLKAAQCRLKCWSWGDFIFSLQRAGVKPDKQLLKAAANAMLRDSDSLKKIRTPYIMGLVEAIHAASFSDQGLFQLLAEVLVERIDCLTPRDLSKVALTCGQASCKDDALVQSLCEAIRQNLPSFPKNRISYTIHGLSLLDCKDTQLLVDLASAWAITKPEESIEVLLIITGLARSGALDPSLCDRIATCSLQCVPHFNARSIATILLACAKSGCTDAEFLESLGKAASLKIPEFSTTDLCAVSFAAAKLSLAPILGDCVLGAALERVSDFKGAQLALMMHAASRLSDTPSECLQVLEHAILPHVPTLTPVDLRYISMAWTRARVSTEEVRAAVAARTIDVIDSLDSSTISHIAWAHSKLQVSNADLFKALGVRCAATISSFSPSRLGCAALAFVEAGVHEEVPLVSIARQALRSFGQMHPVPGSRLARAFIQADLESSEITALLESLASVARQQGWTCLSPSGLEQTDFQKQCTETVQEFLPSILGNQRHEMGPLLGLVLPHCDGSHLNLEVDPLDLQLSRLDRAVRTRRDQFLEDLGVQVLRFKVRDQDDLRYHLLQIFGHPAASTMAPGMDESLAEPQALEVGPLGEEAVAMCGRVWNEMESGRVQQQHESLL